MQPTPADLSPALPWALPFLVVLGAIALGPALLPRRWPHYAGPVMGLIALARLVPLAALSGAGAAAAALYHALAEEYLPFVALLGGLYVCAGGILVRGGPWGRPWGNTLLLAIGTLLAGVIGTTGAAMVLIHPLLRANAHRTRKVHLVVFFTVLVANAGGALSPLGDPPLYLGYLNGVPFFWPTKHLALPLALVALPLLGAFWLLDRSLARSEPPAPPPEPLALRGGWNLALLGIIVVTVAGGVDHLLASAIFIAAAALSLRVTAHAVRADNHFTWHPIIEVAIVFATIFITIDPVLAMLRAGSAGPFAPLLALTTGADGTPSALVYFWLTGMLSGFLDNAPTYLVFHGLAGIPRGISVGLNGGPGSAGHLLVAISSGAVFAGGLTYIGNAPNLMLRAIAAHRGVRMPGFAGYLGWAALLLAVPFAALSILIL
ncbi:MAG: sodium:proton antiporter [Rhodospirillales bacterium]|nr:sodium:proton antiporter [Rhodospirillales bacterium]